MCFGGPGQYNYVCGKDFDIKVKYLNLVEVNYLTSNTTIFSDVNHLSEEFHDHALRKMTTKKMKSWVMWDYYNHK